MRALQDVADPARAVGGDDSLGLAGGAGGEADAAPCVGRYGRKGARIRRFWVDVFYGDGIAAESTKRVGLISGGDSKTRLRECQAMAAFGFREARVQRHLGGADEAQGHGAPDCGNAVRKAADDRLAWLHAAVAKHGSKACGMTGQIGKADRRRAVMHGFERSEPVNRGGEFGAPRYPIAHSSCATGLRRVPMALISTSTVSPCFIHSGGVR